MSYTTEELQKAVDDGVPLITRGDTEPCLRVEVLDPVSREVYAVVLVCDGDTISVTGDETLTKKEYTK